VPPKPAALPLPWAPPQRPHTFLAGLLTQFLSGCAGSTALHWHGAVFAAGGEADGWWLKMSMEAEASLRGLRALALHAVDVAPGVALSAAEAAHMRAVRARWAAFGSARAGGGEGVGAEGEEGVEEEEEPPRPRGSASSASSSSGTDEVGEAAYVTLTQRVRGLGVLVLDARAGACRLLAEKQGLQLGGLRVFHAGGQASSATTGTAVEVPHANLTAAAAAPHLAAIFKGMVLKS
jgi:hypothetical protein